MNLLLQYRSGGVPDIRFRGAARICVDSETGLTLTDPETGCVDKIPLEAIEVLSILSLSRAPRLFSVV